ncbi:MAG: RES family NAD+ phosphorylase [Deltaproteobacteria bacterium]|nr:RES family NAD+ phosphorylase [Deltaproteobacteria bacterium]
MKCDPPGACPGTPVCETLGMGTSVIRIHLNAYAANEFNPTPATSPVKGGRFDHTSPGEAFLYAGETLETAVAEALLRDLPPQPAPRVIPFAQVQGRSVSRLRTRRNLELLSLHGRGLSQLGQDSWLTSCDACDYPITRRWATAIRRWAPGAAGFVWRSRRLQDELAYVFYSTRVGPKGFEVKATRRADQGAGLDEIRQILAAHLAVLGGP